MVRPVVSVLHSHTEIPDSNQSAGHLDFLFLHLTVDYKERAGYKGR